MVLSIKSSNTPSPSNLNNKLSRRGPSTTRTSKHFNNGECLPINVRKDSTKWQLESQTMHRMIGLRR